MWVGRKKGLIFIPGADCECVWNFKQRQVNIKKDVTLWQKKKRVHNYYGYQRDRKTQDTEVKGLRAELPVVGRF